MRFTNGADVNGTSLRGYITTSYDELAEIFGEPDYGPNDHSGDKVTCEWSLQFEDGTVATIYEWKHGYTPMDRCQWNIGGKSMDAVVRITQTVERYRELTTQGA
jgi:hypothetical protein